MSTALAPESLKREQQNNCKTLVSSKSINSASLLKIKPLFRRAYVGPFLAVYFSILAGALTFAYYAGFNPFHGVHFEIVSGIFCAAVFVNLIVFLGTFWSVQFCAISTYTKCTSVSVECCSIMIIPAKHKGKNEIVSILQDSNNNLYFTYQQNKFIWNSSEGCFEKPTFPVSLSFADYSSQSQGNGLDNAEDLLNIYGKNTFHIPHPSFAELFQEHAVAPFFLFQVFCVGLWLLDEYWYYSLFTLFMLIIFECTVVHQRLNNLKEFKTMSIKAYSVECKRNGQWISCPSDELLPGDLVRIGLQEGAETTIPCDMLLLDGNCIVNEAMLSGESTPLQKESIKDREANEILSLTDDKVHILYAGTKLLQVNSIENANHALCFVLKTGFHTTQGKLVRTMIYNSENVTANNLESFLFILFLLMFAIAASIYVWKEGIKDPERSRFKLILECIIIITQVIPPELPMELSLAVNASLMALTQFAIFCTEPFRIPFAGKVDVCCLDKTGTITEENLVVQGISGVTTDNPNQLLDCSSAPRETLIVLGACHSLALVDNKYVGDPMELAAFQHSPWQLVNADVVVSKSSNQRIRILKKFHFSSTLKRMSTVCSISEGSHEKTIVTVKGAPEVLHCMFDNAPEWYSEVYKKFAKQGCRVISLGMKTMPKMSASMLHSYVRDDAESNLKFCGFLVFHCPLKKDSAESIKALNDSSHKVVMITGDNSLTSVHVASCVGILKNESKCLLIDTLEGDEETLWISNISEDISRSVSNADLLAVIPEYHAVCITGSAYNVICANGMLNELLPKISVFARASPAQKESIMVSYKEQKLVTLMCGDGTNDVGALKQAHIGVALLDGKPEDLEKIKKRMRLEAFKKQQESLAAFQKKIATKLGQEVPEGQTQERMVAINNALNDSELPSIKLGDASVAAPFTSKISSLDSVCTIIKQGRCTLVTTLQMYKILALNSLISAFSLSVLHLEGIRYADVQSTIMGFLITFCFLFLSKAKPLTKLAAQRPQSNIFNVYVMFSLMSQFVIHLISLFAINQIASFHDPVVPKPNSEFAPSLKNSMVYLISLSMQVCTFMVNYQGHPFRESLLENKPLRNCLFGVGAVGFILALEVFPEINEYLQIVKFSSHVKTQLITVMLFNYASCAIVEKVSQVLFANRTTRSFFDNAQETTTLTKKHA